MKRTSSALARRYFLHQRDTGALKPEDLARLVACFEELEEMGSELEVVLLQVLEDNHALGYTDPNTLNKIEKLFKKYSLGES